MTLKLDAKALVIAGLCVLIGSYLLGHVPVLRAPPGCSTFVELTDPTGPDVYTLSLSCAKRPTLLLAYPFIDFATLKARQEAAAARAATQEAAAYAAQERIAEAERRAAAARPPKDRAAAKPK